MNRTWTRQTISILAKKMRHWELESNATQVAFCAKPLLEVWQWLFRCMSEFEVKLSLRFKYQTNHTLRLAIFIARMARTRDIVSFSHCNFHQLCCKTAIKLIWFAFYCASMPNSIAYPISMLTGKPTSFLHEYISIQLQIFFGCSL